LEEAALPDGDGLAWLLAAPPFIIITAPITSTITATAAIITKIFVTTGFPNSAYVYGIVP
jgi:hypothetical protein